MFDKIIDFMQQNNVPGCQRKVSGTNGQVTSSVFGDVNVYTKSQFPFSSSFQIGITLW